MLIGQTEGNFSNLSEKEKGLFFQTFDGYFEAYNSFVLKAIKRIPSLTGWLYNTTLVIKGVLFQSSEKIRQNILNSGDTALINKYQDWKAKKDYLAKVYQMPIAEKQKQKIDEKKLETEANQIEKELAQQSELFAQATDKTRYTWQDVQKTLKPNEAAIEIIRTRYYDKKWTDSILYIALVVKPETKDQPEMVVLGNGKDLEKKYLNNYKNSIQAQKTDKYSYEQYWSKLALQLKGVKKVFVSVDGVYNSLDINTLMNLETTKYLGDELDIQLVSNTEDLVKFANNPKALAQNLKAYQVHLFGFPDYSGKLEKIDTTQQKKDRTFTMSRPLPKLDSTQRFLSNDGKIAVLSSTKTEVENIEVFCQKQQLNTKVYLARQASEENVKALKNPNILHIATHGYFLTDLPDTDDLEDSRAFGGIESKRFVENPLLRCGLLLANAEHGLKQGEVVGQENGVLTAQEAMNLNLDKTDLVVMSACETGLGEISNREGVYGLQRAFQQAGAKTILMSLWTVSDEATQELMTLFYENWLTKEQTKREAFKNAQNELKNKFPQPYYWGAFVMVGE